MALSAAVLLLVVGLGVLLVVIPKLTGATPLAVLTSSMEPGLPPGTLIVVRPVAAGELRIGDVVTYQLHSGEPAVVTHRIRAITASSDGSQTFTVQGDNNGAPDSDPVLPEQIQGRLWYSLPALGFVATVVNGAAQAWIVPLVAVGLFAYSGFLLAGWALQSRVRRRAADASYETRSTILPRV